MSDPFPLYPTAALADLIDLEPRDLVAIVGAGGKTTTLFRLAAELAERGRRVVSSKSTMIARPTLRRTPHLLLSESLAEAIARLPAELAEHPHLSLVAGLLREDLYRGLDPDWIAAIQALPAVDHLLIEADGARRRLVKAPGDHEPVMPSAARVVIAIACLDVIGRPLDDTIAHRPERIAAIAGRPIGDPIEPIDLARLLTDPAGGRKNLPAGARFYPLLTRLDVGNRPAAEAIAAAIWASGLADGVIGSRRTTVEFEALRRR